ncbi:hypothetical protein AK830_g351 [Neonectria ditissima]|uniref:Uncharacterized protein n=1 Tax=Neonectria ditissima TaxID=78410 RepID=A0A0P7BYK7_9HYPO|nr:hypothetical protein AK830_g351 [Neonectria ditissima]
MAEIEMEVDMAKPLNQDAHLDDDFIDFDTDMLDQPELTSLPSADPGKLTEVTSNHPEDDVYEAANIENLEQNEVDAALLEESDLDVAKASTNDMDAQGTDASYTADPVSFGTKDSAVSLAEQSEHDGANVEIAAVDENVYNTFNEPHESDHEIDYELGEQAEENEPHGELELNVEETLAVPSFDVTVENTVDDGVLQPTEDAVSERPEDGHSDHGGYEDHSEQVDEDEITYDDDDDEVREPELAPVQDDEDATKDELDDEAQTNDEGVNGEDEQSENQAARDEGFGDEYGAIVVQSEVMDEIAKVSSVHFHEQPENQTIQDGEVEDVEYGAFGVDSEQQEPSVSGHDSVAASETDFPAITVQYKGDEFPFFSNASDGFFTETSILDETVEKLLSGFREELANEIAHEEELVFQVDELGLEFAESCLRDLSSVTLRQILEIFDLLVKNQDPDSSRTLYTYLFTRPCASKRLEFLIESATAGKGLDEVIHLFESPVQATASVLETNTADGRDERLDEFESPTDEADEIRKEDIEDDISYAEDGVDLKASILDNDEDADEDEQNINGVEQNANEGDQGAAEGDYTEGQTIEPTPGDMLGTDDQTSHVAATEEPVESNAHDESESNPLINLDLDDGTKEYEEVDLEVGSDADEPNPIDLDLGNVGTANSSTTTTLKDDGDGGSTILDADTDATAAVLPDKVEEAGDDDVGEIDWRDEPEVVELPSTPSAFGKRARGDDEVDAEDEQDVKRRRP